MSAAIDRRKLVEVRCGQGACALRVYSSKRVADADRFVELWAYDVNGNRVALRLGARNALRVVDAIDAVLDEWGVE